MEAEQQIDDLRLVVSDMQKGSSQLEFESILFAHLNYVFLPLVFFLFLYQIFV